MYITVKNENDFNRILEFSNENNIEIEHTNEVLELVAGEIIDYRIDNNLLSDSEIDFVNNNKCEIVKNVGHELKQLFSPISDEHNHIIDRILINNRE